MTTYTNSVQYTLARYRCTHTRKTYSVNEYRINEFVSADAAFPLLQTTDSSVGVDLEVLRAMEAVAEELRL